jgi:hypothetical protein
MRYDGKTMSKTPLTTKISPDDFWRIYWLKSELLEFCRTHKLSTQGGKIELAARIGEFLHTGKQLKPSKKPTPTAKMPTQLTRATVIGVGWRCSQALRLFFQAEIGKHFHFDQVMRDFIAQGTGKTLEEAITVWQQPRQKTEIAPQFEYNRHTRAFYAANPNATRQEALTAWETHKAKRQES